MCTYVYIYITNTMMVTIMTDNDDDVGDGGSLSSVGEDHENIGDNYNVYRDGTYIHICILFIMVLFVYVNMCIHMHK